jgi:hypothetical protein
LKNIGQFTDFSKESDILSLVQNPSFNHNTNQNMKVLKLLPLIIILLFTGCKDREDSPEVATEIEVFVTDINAKPLDNVEISVLGKKSIYLNSPNVVNEYFEKKKTDTSGKYSFNSPVPTDFTLFIAIYADGRVANEAWEINKCENCDGIPAGKKTNVKVVLKKK